MLGLHQLKQSDPELLEHSDPFLAREFIKIANGTHERIKKLTEKNIILKPSKSNEIKRNDLCPCGSGKKYKKCCLNN